MTASTHSWKFSRIGGFDQALIQSAEDLRNVQGLDPKLWAALSCPVRGLEFCERTLALIDSDQDGRVREPEIKAAVAWACSVLKDPNLLFTPKDDIKLGDINTSIADGEALAASAAEILRTINKSETDSLTIADVADHHKYYAKQPFNGDGFINTSASDVAELKTTIADIQKAFPDLKDSYGEAGIDRAHIEAFFKLCAQRLEWLKSKATIEIPTQFELTDTLPVYDSVAAKIDDYFSRAAILHFQASAAQSVNTKEIDWQNALTSLLTAELQEIANFPLAAIDADTVDSLPLTKGLNPAWFTAMDNLSQKIVQPLFGKQAILSLAQWQQVKEIFKPYKSWLANEVAKEISGLDEQRLTELLNSDQKSLIESLIDKDIALMPQAKNFLAVERILRYRLNLVTLLNNFVNFVDFYSPEKNAIFQAGTLYLDGRGCDLCIEVHDGAKHAALAGLSKCFLAYCTCIRPNGAKKDIVAAFTGGDSDYLLVGRNGVFIDRAGKDWDATISKIIENPISIPQAFFSPYKRLIRFIEEQAAKKASAADSSSDALLQNVTKQAGDSTSGKTPPTKPKFDIGIVAAIGVAVGGIATAFGMLLQAFFGLGIMMPVGLLGLLLVISGPSMFIAWLKLRQRNLGPILDASGWAINGRVKINIPFGSTLTSVAKLPSNARRDFRDPFKEKGFPWVRTIVALVVVVVVGGSLYSKVIHNNWPWESQTPAVIVVESPEK